MTTNPFWFSKREEITRTGGKVATNITEGKYRRAIGLIEEKSDLVERGKRNCSALDSWKDTQECKRVIKRANDRANDIIVKTLELNTG